MASAGVRAGFRVAVRVAITAAFLGSGISGGSAQGRDVVVFAAASLKNALDEVAEGWETDTGQEVTISYAASSALARQIEAGAPADIFISADLDWMNELAKSDLVKPESRRELLGNRLVLVAPAHSDVDVEIGPGMDLKSALGGGKLAMADTTAVPAGKYGKAALQSLGAWDRVEGEVAQAENVRAALALVSRGEAPLGIVYATDAAADPAVKVLGAFPENSHPLIIYPAALVAASDHPHGAAFLDYLNGEDANAVFREHGFVPLD